MQKLEDLDLTGDVSLLSYIVGHMQAKTERLCNIDKTAGLEINVTKTKNMRINASQQAPSHPLTVDGQAIEEVDRFTYLGCIVSKTGGTNEDVKARTNKARQAFAALRPVWRSKNLRCCTKLRLFNSNVKSVLLYGAETWRDSKK